MLSELVEALQIFLKYGDISYPTHCEHDVLRVNVDYKNVSEEDRVRLDKLGFIEDSEFGTFMSFRFGSA